MIASLVVHDFIVIVTGNSPVANLCQAEVSPPPALAVMTGFWACDKPRFPLRPPRFRGDRRARKSRSPFYALLEEGLVQLHHILQWRELPRLGEKAMAPRKRCSEIEVTEVRGFL